MKSERSAEQNNDKIIQKRIAKRLKKYEWITAEALGQLVKFMLKGTM